MVIKTMLRSLIVNFILSILKIIISILTNSKTLLADAVHGVSDLSTDIVALTGAKIASKKPDKSHPFGHGKMEYVTSIFISLFIIFLGITIFKNSFTPSEMKYSIYLFLIMPITIVLKFILSNYLIRNGKKLNSNILLSSGTESRFDMINTTFAFLVIITSYYQKYIGILKYADMFGSIVISIFTIRIGLNMFLKNTKSVLGEIDNNQEKQEAIKKIIMNHKQVQKVEKITLLKYGPYTSLTVDIVMNSNLILKSIYKIEVKIKKEIKKAYTDIKYIAINVKPKK